MKSRMIPSYVKFTASIRFIHHVLAGRLLKSMVSIIRPAQAGVFTVGS